jgi:hypothetical protein
MNAFEAAASLLRCPWRGAAPLSFEGTCCLCQVCGVRYPIRGRILDFVPAIGASRSRSQRVMENPWVAKIYEDHWRPRLTALGSQLDYAQEEAWLNAQNVLSGEGPVLDLACGTGWW